MNWVRTGWMLMALAAPLARAELKPQWELGLGLAAVDFPAYRGASERRNYLLPAPYVQYRGDVVQVNRERVRGMLFRHDRVELDISLNGSVPAKDAAARSGMPDLDPTLEIGPSLNVHLLFDERRRTNLDLRLPLRAVIATNLRHFDRQGWLFQPKLALDLNGLGHGGWSFSVSAGLVYGDQAYHGYFYDVAPQYATAVRPAYSAPGGYSGKQYMTTLSTRRGDFWLGAFLRWDDLSGAVIADSPLVERRQAFSGGVMLAWVFAKSDKQVEVSDD